MNVHHGLELSGDAMGRRQFMSAVTRALAAFGLAGAVPAAGAPTIGSQQAWDGCAEVCLVFCDERGVAGSRRGLVETILTRACPRIKYSVVSVHDPGQAREIVGRTEGVDGYIVWVFGRPGEAAKVFTRSSRPVVLAIDEPARYGLAA